MRIDNPSISGSLSFIQGTNTISGTSVSLTGSLSGTFEGAFSGDSLTNISGAFDSVSASLASGKLNNTTDTLDGDLTVTGKITAQEFHTEFVSASIIYESGSTQFGDSSDDTHIFSGSISVSNGIAGTLSTAAQTNITSVGTLSSLGISGNLTVDTNTLYVDTSNNRVGVGTSSPASELDIDGGAVGDIRIRGNQTTDVRIGGLNFYNTAGSDVVASVTADRDGADTAGAIAFDTQPSGGSNTERMRIDSSGNVGIGTTSPGAKLHVDAGSVSTPRGSTFTKFFFTGDSTNTTYLELQTPSNSSGDILFSDGSGGAYGLLGYDHNTDSMRFYTNSSERIRITSAGNVGIGTSSPFNVGNQTSLSVNGVSYGRLDLYNSGTHHFYAYGGSGFAAIGATSSATNGLIFEANGAERMRITSGGQVLIGTTSSVTSVNIGYIIKMRGLVKYYADLFVPSPYTQSIQIDITWNNWGSNSVIAVADLSVTSRQFSVTAGIAFGTLFATNVAQGALLSSINTTDITTSQCTLTASSPSNYTLRLVIDPSNITDIYTVSLELPKSAGPEIASINVTLV